MPENGRKLLRHLADLFFGGDLYDLTESAARIPPMPLVRPAHAEELEEVHSG